MVNKYGLKMIRRNDLREIINKGVVGGICIPYEFIIDSYKQRRVVVCKGRELVENQREEL
jgi:hypothetical protein